ncbi:MAG TPA: hypothetical protein VFG54_12100 [Prolixibacteraceae bacterium]|nr:hypothetical protein [Prolixibacteraceae bacterium]
MKKIIIALMVLCLTLPGMAQSKKDLKYEIYTLKKQVTEIQALKTELAALKEENQALKEKIKNLEFRSTPGTVSSPVEAPGDQLKNDEADKPMKAGRCQAITQAGAQCKRLPSEGSRYCWQHAHQEYGQKQSGSSTKSTTKSSYGSSSGSGRTIHTGPRGGKYYINKNGNKTYIK